MGSAARLQHPNIVQIYEVGELAGRPFLSMEYVDGGTLADLIRQGAIPPESVVGLVLQLAEAMDDAHQSGVIHRDLKPANVLLTSGGEPKITDFGLAKQSW